MKQLSREDLLEVVGCEIDLRPQAPGIAEIAALATSVVRADTSIVARFPASAAAAVDAFAAAERQCCAGLGWHVERGDEVTLRITATRPALDVLEGALTGNYIEQVK